MKTANPPARLMCGARCLRVTLERGSTLTVLIGGRPVRVRVRDLAASRDGEIQVELQGTG